MFDKRFEATLLVMLMKTGEPTLTALRVVALGFSPTFGRFRFTIGDGC